MQSTPEHLQMSCPCSTQRRAKRGRQRGEEASCVNDRDSQMSPITFDTLKTVISRLCNPRDTSTSCRVNTKGPVHRQRADRDIMCRTCKGKKSRIEEKAVPRP